MSSDSDFFDVVIIGASIAGNYLAYLLSRFHMRVLIIEEHSEIGLPLQCAGIISKKLTHLIELPSNLIYNRVKIARLVSPSGSSIKLSGNEEPYIIDRIGLDRLFYERVKNNKNIKYLLGEKFKSFDYIVHEEKQIIELKTSSKSFKTQILIGCDGPLSTVAKKLNNTNDLLYAFQVRIKADFNENEASMYFHQHWKELFGWIVPEGNHVYRIGIASKKNPSKAFRRFTKLIGINQNDAIERLGGLIPYGMMKKCAFDNVLLLGDAACQVKATTGGGIVMLLTAAKFAAICVKKCLEIGNSSRKFIQRNYENPLRATIGKQLKIHYIIRKLLENLTVQEFETLFRIIKSNKIEKLISLYGDMDFPKDLAYGMLKNWLFQKFIIKLGLKHPTLIVKIIFIYFFS